MATVYVLTYCHRHGETTSVCSTEAKAYKAAAQIVAENIDTVFRPALRRRMIEALNAQKYQTALALWGHYQCDEDNDESISISPCEVDAGLDDRPIKIRRKGTSE